MAKLPFDKFKKVPTDALANSQGTQVDSKFYDNPTICADEAGGDIDRMYNIYTKKGAKTYREKGDLGQYPQSRFRSRRP